MDAGAERKLREAVNALSFGVSDAEVFDERRLSDFEGAILAAQVVHDESRVALHQWVHAGRRVGMSWADVGELLGISKQAAQQRFRIEDEQVAGQGDLITRSGLTAFNEMRVLAAEGRDGRELVAIGPLALMFRETATAWEYRRTVGLVPSAPAGWSHVASWFPFHYFKRPVPGARIGNE